ncbi:MAG TPA: hypothetical protein VFT16_02260 [Candidatus Saccharimonadales bacterium]|nr:hypothetical protein [Candidatus Saccharimonadales bacterium]
MSELQTLTQRQALDVLADPRDMPDDIVARISLSRPHPDSPFEQTPSLVVPEAFSAALDDLIAEKGPDGPQRDTLHSRWATYDCVVALGRTSILMAHMLGGDVSIPRPRLLHEHTQSELNVHSEYFTGIFKDPRDRVMPVAHFMKDIGKSYAVATHPEKKNKDQGIHNSWVTARLLQDSNLNADERTVVQLHVEEESIGWALKSHTEKGFPLEDVLQKTRADLQSLLDRCPDDYRDRFMFQLAGITFSDMAAHTQRAYYTSARDGRIYQDVTDGDRYIHGDPANGETKKTLDRLFSEAPEDKDAIRFCGVGRIAVIQGLFPDHYEHFVSQADNA